MNYILLVIQLIISILLSVAVIMQSKGAGIGSTFGGSTSFHRSRRGVEKVLFNATILLSILFILTAFANIILA